MKAAMITFLAAVAMAQAKIASSVLRDLEVSGASDVYITLDDVTPVLKALPESAGPNAVRDALVEHATASQKEALALLDGQKTEWFWIANSIVCKGCPDEVVKKVAALSNVKSVVKLPVVSVPEVLVGDSGRTEAVNEWGVDTVGAPKVWPYYTGKGAVVGSIDTGAFYTHEVIKNNWREDKGWFDAFAKSVDKPADIDGHGSHTIGTIAGANGIGVAPGAQWISCRGLINGQGSAESLLTCAQFMLCPTDPNGKNPDCKKAPHVVNNSWGGSSNDLWFQPAAAAWIKAGIIPVFSNGNSGPACATTGNPGFLGNVISVGALGSWKTDSPVDLAFFSSKGPAKYNDANGKPLNLVKPDIAAPGFYTRSAGITAPNAYVKMAGTSMAAPHVAGVVGLLKSAKTDLTYDEVYAYITKYAYTQGLTPEPATWVGKANATLPGAPNCGGVSDASFPNNRYGFGRVDVANAFDNGKLKPVNPKPAC
ncbi:serine protease family S08A [Achlya hypogyna]|uniref:subtilisin n=1 Tax=Achlya hypogyna TaxID=1202772 RepID=A0A0A7CND6_ACHHY|nr:secreted protein [Achlya hypogyna]OQR88907.1 serine protease family S08A [Achlya hypogyna]